jgi:methyl-accepting chemotaxis protein
MRQKETAMRATINNWQLSRKMLAAFALIALLFAGVAATGIVTNAHLDDVASHHITRGLAGSVAIGEVLSQIREQRIIVYSRYTAVDAAEARKLETRLAKNQAALVADVAEYRRVAGAGFEPDVDRLDALVGKLNSVSSRIFVVRAGATPDAALALIKTEGKDASHDALDEAEALVAKTVARAKAANTAGQAYAATALTVSAALSTIALLCLLGIWYLISRTVARPMAALAETTTRLAAGEALPVPSRDRGDELGRIARAVESFSDAATQRAAADAVRAAEQSNVTLALGTSLKAISDGDLTLAVTAQFPPAYLALKTDFNQALSGLSGLIGAVGEGVSAIRSGSQEIAQASEDLARRTEANAASLEQTSAALVQIENRLKDTATASTSTVARANEAIASVGGGRLTAEQAVAAMGRVSVSAKGIDSVIEGVDKIAFQTRVLAMNAAVEAGRAGDAGRGFAVVADLVSALAMRAEEEAKRARDQLTVTQAEIRIAVDAVHKVDGAFADISGNVDAVHTLLARMANDNLAQSVAITEITAAVGSMDRATQQNAAMVEETSAAARSLTTEVESLAELAGTFRTDGGAAHRARPARQQKQVHMVPPVAGAGHEVRWQ